MAERPQAPALSGYSRFRRSPTFTMLLITFITMWVTANLLHHFDADWATINLILSVEGAVSLSIMNRDSARHEAFVTKLLDYIADNTVATRDAVAAIREALPQLERAK